MTTTLSLVIDALQWRGRKSTVLTIAAATTTIKEANPEDGVIQPEADRQAGREGERQGGGLRICPFVKRHIPRFFSLIESVFSIES